MGEEEVVFVRRASGLVRELEWWDVMIWSLAAPAASGMTYYAVKMLGDPTAYGGNEVLAFLLAGLMFIPLIIAFAIITSSFPRSSSLYVFVSRVIHPIVGYVPFWYWIVGGGAAMVSGFLLFIGLKALSGAWTIAAVAGHSSTLLSQARILTKPMDDFVLAVILIIVVWAINYFGVRAIKWSLRILTIIPLAVTVSVLGALAFAGHNVGVADWDKLFGAGTAEEIMKVAFNGGTHYGVHVEPLKPLSMLKGTYGMLLWTLWAWTGMEAVTFVGSEVKNPSASFIKGYTGGFIAIMALYLANAYLLPHVLGYKFMAAYSYLQMNYPDVLKHILRGLPTPAGSVPLMASVVFPGKALDILLGITYFLWYFNTVLVIWVGGVRGFFSLAFDRLLPEKLTEVSPRWAAPTWANHVTAILAVLGAIFTLGDSMGSSLAAGVVSFMDFSCLFFVWPVGLALMMIPWWRPELFKRMTFQSKAAAFIVGLITFAIGWYFMIYTTYTEIPVMITNIIVGVIGIGLFIWMSARNRAKGIPVEKIYTQIPPA